jgi:hypothetical protein
MTKTAAPPEQSLLPSAKTPVNIDPLRKKTILWGQPKIGKSTLVSQLDDNVLFLATEPGLDALEVFKVDITSWKQFRAICAEIAEKVKAGEFEHPVIAVDTVDALVGLCAEDVLDGLSGGSRNRFVHASDFDYGKGWSAIEQEFKLRVAKLCNLGVGVVFLSHLKEGSVKKANGAEVTKLGPDIGQKGIRKWLLGFVDYIFMADIVATADGEQRVLRTQPTENVEAGGRVPPGAEPLPAMLPLQAEQLRAALAKVAAA